MFNCTTFDCSKLFAMLCQLFGTCAGYEAVKKRQERVGYRPLLLSISDDLKKSLKKNQKVWKKLLTNEE